MQTVSFYGASDDLIEIEGIPGADEFNVWERGLIQGAFDIKSSQGSMRVYVIYDGKWSFAPAINPDNEDGNSLPSWPIRLFNSTENGYSTQFEVDVPADAILEKTAKWKKYDS